jgi:hypothetical protein
MECQKFAKMEIDQHFGKTSSNQIPVKNTF